MKRVPINNSHTLSQTDRPDSMAQCCLAPPPMGCKGPAMGCKGPAQWPSADGLQGPSDGLQGPSSMAQCCPDSMAQCCLAPPPHERAQTLAPGQREQQQRVRARRAAGGWTRAGSGAGGRGVCRPLTAVFRAFRSGETCPEAGSKRVLHSD